MWVRIPAPQIKLLVSVMNPEVCPQCGRTWKRVNEQDKSTECYECREYLDNESDD